MELYARVNILDGRAVRLPTGDVRDAIALDADPVSRARGWVEKGATRLHVVDLDASAHGDYVNRPLIERIITDSGVPTQVAGGVRTPHEVTRLLEAGAWRVVMGTAAIEDQVTTWEICREHPGKVAVALDVRPDEELAIRGWTKSSGVYLEQALIDLSSAGVAAFLVAQANRDALTEPANYEILGRALGLATEPIIAAGGARDREDLQRLVDLDVGGRRLEGVIVGREITAGRFTIAEAAELLGDR